MNDTKLEIRYLGKDTKYMEEDTIIHVRMKD